MAQYSTVQPDQRHYQRTWNWKVRFLRLAVQGPDVLSNVIQVIVLEINPEPGLHIPSYIITCRTNIIWMYLWVLFSWGLFFFFFFGLGSGYPKIPHIWPLQMVKMPKVLLSKFLVLYGNDLFLGLLIKKTASWSSPVRICMHSQLEKCGVESEAFQSRISIMLIWVVGCTWLNRRMDLNGSMEILKGQEDSSF